MKRTTTPGKVGKRLNAALRREGKTPEEVMDALGGRAIQTWYRWVNGNQEGGWKDIAEAGLFLGLNPEDLMLEVDEDSLGVFTEDDLVQLESLSKMLGEMNRLTKNKSDVRPVAAVHDHVKTMLKLLKKRSK